MPQQRRPQTAVYHNIHPWIRAKSAVLCRSYNCEFIRKGVPSFAWPLITLSRPGDGQCDAARHERSRRMNANFTDQYAIPISV